jgi:hypothetical protein
VGCGGTHALTAVPRVIPAAVRGMSYLQVDCMLAHHSCCI